MPLVETTPYVVPPFAPVQVNMEGVTHPAILFGRNTSSAKMGKQILSGGQD